MSNVKIADWEYLHAEQILKVYLEHLVSAGADYMEILGAVQSEAIRDGAHGIANECTNRAQEMGGIVANLLMITMKLSGKANSFVSDVDSLDQFLY